MFTAFSVIFLAYLLVLVFIVAVVLVACFIGIKWRKSKDAKAVMESQIAELTREVREHNGFARRMPVVEEQIKVINHRIDDLEGFHKPPKN